MDHFEFDAVIIKNPTLDSGYIEFPYSVKEAFGTERRVKVIAFFDW